MSIRNESDRHLLLKERAKEILFEKGFKEDEIYFEYRIPRNNGFFYRVDVIGIKNNLKVAIECGNCETEKIEDLHSFCDEVLHLKYNNSEITTLRCKASTIKRLREWELHPRETHEEVIIHLIEAKELANKK